MNQMLDPHQNSVRNQPWPAQIEHFHLDVASRILRAAFNQRRPRVSRFKKAQVRTLSQKNKKLRVQYRLDHQHHTVENFFQYVHFTDEAHFDPHETFNERVLREEGLNHIISNQTLNLTNKRH